MEILNELINNQKELQKSFDLLNRKLDEQGKRPPVVNIDSDTISSNISKKLPSVEYYNSVNEDIKSIVKNIPKKVSVDTSFEVIGFYNPKAMFIHYGITIILVLSTLGISTYLKNEEIDKYKETISQYREFRNWIEKQYPKALEKWNKGE
jgi:hypothetical protein